MEAVNSFNFVLAERKSMEEALKPMRIQGRDHVRVPMQWNDQLQAGFTIETPWVKVNSNYTSINIEEAEQGPDSILHYFRELIRFRKEKYILRSGAYRNLDPEHEKIYAYARFNDNQEMRIVCNFSDHELTTSTQLRSRQICLWQL